MFTPRTPSGLPPRDRPDPPSAADEEIELARKIADLLHLEELAAQFESDNGKYPDTKEWAALVDMPVIRFRRRLMLLWPRKRWCSRTYACGLDRQKYMNRGLSFQDLIQEGSWADSCRREIRSREGLQVLHLRHLVDPSGDHARHR